MFRGVNTVSLDGKGRIVVPARHRDVLVAIASGRIVVTADPSECLLLYPLSEWEPIEKKLAGLSDFNPQTRSIKQLMIGYAQDMDMDSAGRILLPPMLRDFAGLDKNVVLAGQVSRLEIWNEERWNARIASALKFSENGLPPELEGLTL
jgi:MraZ protein